MGITPWNLKIFKKHFLSWVKFAEFLTPVNMCPVFYYFEGAYCFIWSSDSLFLFPKVCFIVLVTFTEKIWVSLSNLSLHSEKPFVNPVILSGSSVLWCHRLTSQLPIYRSVGKELSQHAAFDSPPTRDIQGSNLTTQFMHLLYSHILYKVLRNRSLETGTDANQNQWNTDTFMAGPGIKKKVKSEEKKVKQCWEGHERFTEDGESFGDLFRSGLQLIILIFKAADPFSISVF